MDRGCRERGRGLSTAQENFRDRRQNVIVRSGSIIGACEGFKARRSKGDVMDIVARAKAIMLTPKTEWPVIEHEPGDPAYLFSNYVAILAAIPAV